LHLTRSNRRRLAGLPENFERRTEGKAMLDAQNQGPQCTACGSPMKLTAIEPGDTGQDLRTFACPQCKRIQRHVIESAVTEAWLEPKHAAKGRQPRPTE
jgi:hypothetical protein